MILSKMVVKWLEVIIEVGLWLILLVGFIAGWSLGSSFFGSLGMALLTTLGAALSGAALFGFFILLNSINKTVTKISESSSHSGQHS